MLSLVLLVGAFAVSCTPNSKVSGYVGSDASVGGGTTATSNLIVMVPTLSPVLFNEGNQTSVIIQFSRPLPRNTTINWSISNASGEFQTLLGSVSALEGDEQITIPLDPVDDHLYEGDETFYMNLAGDANVFLSAINVPLKIVEAAPQPVVSFAAASQTQLESVGSAPVVVNLSQASATPVTVAFSVAGTATGGNVDYYLSHANEITFDAGETSKTITVHVVDDALGEPQEDILFSLTSVTSGLATIDSANDDHAFYIEGSDGGTLFNILGASGGTDSTVDGYLTNGNDVTVNWGNVPGESGYKVTIFQNNGVTVQCPEQSVAADVTSYTFTGCALSEGVTYKMSVKATVSAVDQAAGNDLMAFTVDTVAPASFVIVGAMGETDIVPDNYLAGTTTPGVAWQDTTGESGYKVSIYSFVGGTEICPEVTLPANVTAYTFVGCDLTRTVHYRIRVRAVDSAGNVTVASNNDFDFLVTEVPAGYIVQGVTGGTADVTKDDYMNDGVDPIVHWEAASGVDNYDITILNMNNSIKCPTQNLPGTATSTTFTNCLLDLHQQYRVKVVAYDADGLIYPAANSPFVFRHQVGLYISGTGGSYYRGLPITSCGGVNGDVCSDATPYVVAVDLFESQIRVSNNGNLTGTQWATGPVDLGNGLLKVSADRLVLDGGGKLSMNAKGFTSANGPGAGANAAVSAGAAHGGNGTKTGVLAQAHAYGSVKLPVTMGSGGGANGVNLGGAGGGVIEVVVNKDLEFSSGGIYASGGNGASGAGGGAGGSIKVTAKNVRGVGGVIQANGGTGGAGGAGAGAGGRVALYYEDMYHSGGITGLGLNTRGGAAGTAQGTIFYQDTAAPGNNPQGYLVADSGTFVHTQGVETPIPLTETFDQIYTRNQATFIVEAADTYTLPTSTLPFRIAVEGILQLPAMGTNLTIATGGYLEWRRADAVDDWSTITIQSGGTLTHTRNTTAKTYYLDIVTTNLNVFGAIDVSGRGYQAGAGTGMPTGGYGAAYGGEGGIYTSGTAGTVYGNIRLPDDLGSGAGGAGGGYVKITTTNLNVTGSIRSNGVAGCGGGSGGSIRIHATNLTGFGAVLAASGGDGATGGSCGANQGGAGGGGRVAIYYTNSTYPGGIPAISFETWGGDGTTDGAGGTIYYKKASDVDGHLMVINGVRDYDERVTTPLTDSSPYDSIVTDFRGTLKIPSATTFELPSDEITYRLVMEGDFTLPGGSTHLKIKNGGYMEMRRNTPIAINTMTIDLGGTLSHSKNNTTKDYFIDIIANDMTVNGLIDATGKGYSGGNGPGVPSAIRKGAGHGGYGGNGGLYTTVKGGSPYNNANLKTPQELGSGSLPDAGAAGAYGGGYVRLDVANTLTVNGAIRAEGQVGQVYDYNELSGGGSGGSIYITTTNIAGGGATISASGGSGTTDGGSYRSYSGAGGRIAIVYDTDSYYEGIRSLITYERLRAFGGTNYNAYAGAAGSIYMYNTGTETNGRVYYNNGSNPHVQLAETPVPTVALDGFETRNNATLIVEAADTFTLPSSTLSFRIVVEGTANIPANNLTIADGGYFEWRKNTTLSLTNLVINYGGVLTHSYNYTTQAYTLPVTATTFTLNGGGKVLLDKRGFRYDYGAGSPVLSGGAAYGGKSLNANPYGSFSNPVDLGSGGGSTSGCSGGGMARFTISGTATLNGSLLSSGDSCSSPGSGGTIYVDTDILAGVTATIRADGGNGGGNGASGGRIALLYNTDNSGVWDMNITAYGGLGTANGAAGTIYFFDKNTDVNGHLVLKNLGRAYSSSYPTVTTQLPTGAMLDTVTVDSDAAVEVPQGQSFTLPMTTVNFRMIVGGDLYLPGVNDTLTIGPQGILELRRPSGSPTFGTPTGIDNLIIQTGGVVTHTYNSNSKAYWVDLDLNNLDIYGTIDANSRGYQNSGPGMTAGRGPSHGGLGGVYSSTTAAGIASPVYGSITAPDTLGSGGSRPDTGYGGGLIKAVVAGTLKMYGVVRANGQNASGGDYQGGAGGGINFDVNILEGSGGRLEAKGGNGNLYYNGAASGGGGRIALKYVTDNYAGSISSLIFDAKGGYCNGYAGAAGTIYRKAAAQLNGDLIINNGTLPYNEGVETGIAENTTFDNVIIGSETSGVFIASGISFPFPSSDIDFTIRYAGDPVFPGNNLHILSTGKLYADRGTPLVLNNLTVEPYGLLSHVRNVAPSVNDRKLIVQANDIHLKPDSLVDVSGRGYPGSQGPGAGAWAAGFVRGGGGAYGGNGGRDTLPYDTSAAGVSYGSNTDPVDLGSGGGGIHLTSYNRSGAAGGGYVRLETTGTLTFEGRILANGATGIQESGSYLDRVEGGGSGGGVALRANILAGAFGEIQANGGSSTIYSGSYSGGSGGGGRISVKATTDNYNMTMSSITTSVVPGAALADRLGTAGTVYQGALP